MYIYLLPIIPIYTSIFSNKMSMILFFFKGKFESLAEMGIPVLQALFLNDFLLQGSNATETHLLPEYR